MTVNGFSVDIFFILFKALRTEGVVCSICGKKPLNQVCDFWTT